MVVAAKFSEIGVESYLKFTQLGEVFQDKKFLFFEFIIIYIIHNKFLIFEFLILSQNEVT